MIYRIELTPKVVSSIGLGTKLSLSLLCKWDNTMVTNSGLRFYGLNNYHGQLRNPIGTAGEGAALP